MYGFCHDDMTCPKHVVVVVKKQNMMSNNSLQNASRKAFRGPFINTGPKFQFKPAKLVYKPVSKKNGASTSGTK